MEPLVPLVLLRSYGVGKAARNYAPLRNTCRGLRSGVVVGGELCCIRLGGWPPYDPVDVGDA